MTQIGVVGLGYAGYPLAVSFAESGFSVVGYDVDEEKVDALRSGDHSLAEATGAEAARLTHTSEPERLSACGTVFVSVPTPITESGEPDTSAVREAGRTIGAHLSEDTTVVLQSTIYPGGTRRELVPAIEEASGWTAGEEFSVGYAPERSSPGAETRDIEEIERCVAAQDAASRARIRRLFETVLDAPVHPVATIEACEAAKCLENVQRDVNIALVNEFAMACERVEALDADEVLRAAATKWNFHSYRPGLVDGHCIPVDPHYLIHRFEEADYSPELMKTARRVNDRAADHVVELTCDALAQRPQVVADGGVDGRPTVPARGSSNDVLAVGLTYKSGADDLRVPTRRRAIAELSERQGDVVGYDPHASPAAAAETFDVPIQAELDPEGFDALVVFTDHELVRRLDLDRVSRAMSENPVLVDATQSIDRGAARERGFIVRGM
ncbi:nucleotide sugar dehydrogenase [Halobellus limi]|uniref:UDP-N-acetyl-D-mannosamine dehydrogenase n=1 Tax=Halobellus limi TaxID=699433 RepID=A0A1H5TZR0_9EURY|nr:nucleotide sugar dehydrogenase [Halobellus limi]QCC47187.1 nucleotide sugar dehydrogenase [Halobellus limi]SEF68239.1 UDP-N-acetyl-D-galactosamine dehydrogenase [Halobellus limi]